MATKKSSDTSMDELQTLAASIPFKVIEQPEFKRRTYEPEKVRQPRDFTSPDSSMQAIGRFLIERGTVELLAPAQTNALFLEMHWCGWHIQALAKKKKGTPAERRANVVMARRLISRIEAAEEELFVANRRLVVSCAKPFFWIGQVWIGDFLQEGSRALSNAIRKFDYTRGTPFYAYAQRAIQNRLRNFFRDHVRSGSIGVRPTAEMRSIMEALARAKENKDEEPDNEKLARITGVTEKRVAELRPFVRQWENTPMPPVSLDAMLGDTDANLYDFVEGVGADDAKNAAERTEIWQTIDQLSPRAKYIMELRFIEGRTLEETGQILNLTRARIKQIEDESLKKIRFLLKRHRPEA